MKESTAWHIYFASCIMAFIFCLYAVITEGFESNKMTILYTILIWGGIGLFWAVYNKLSKR